MRWWVVMLLLMGTGCLAAGGLKAQLALPAATPLVQAKRALAAKQFVEATKLFAAYVKEHPDDVPGRLGLADAELGLREYEAAELQYRMVVAKQPLLWSAHRNLVIVEAALGRWEEFDRERAVLHAARERGAAGISARDSDVIDVLTVRRSNGKEAERWIVRDYFEPAGRSRARYNFERFSAEGKVLAYVSLESGDAFRNEAKVDSVLVGPAVNDAGDSKGFALDWYDGKSHGVIARYATEPSYEMVRGNFLRWTRGR